MPPSAILEHGLPGLSHARVQRYVGIGVELILINAKTPVPVDATHSWLSESVRGSLKFSIWDRLVPQLCGLLLLQQPRVTKRDPGHTPLQNPSNTTVSGLQTLVLILRFFCHRREAPFLQMLLLPRMSSYPACQSAGSLDVVSFS